MKRPPPPELNQPQDATMTDAQTSLTNLTTEVSTLTMASIFKPKTTTCLKEPAPINWSSFDGNNWKITRTPERTDRSDNLSAADLKKIQPIKPASFRTILPDLKKTLEPLFKPNDPPPAKIEKIATFISTHWSARSTKQNAATKNTLLVASRLLVTPPEDLPNSRMNEGTLTLPESLISHLWIATISLFGTVANDSVTTLDSTLTAPSLPLNHDSVMEYLTNSAGLDRQAFIELLQPPGGPVD